ncbi:MAG: hypothetical protein WCA21_06995 [Terracidiphilus sp.]
MNDKNANQRGLSHESTTTACTGCGTLNPTAAKFCEECGAPQIIQQQMPQLNAHQSVTPPESSKNGVDSVVRILLSVAVILLGAIASLLAVQTLHHPPEEWQYTVIAPSDADLEKVLNNDGADGWEVVSSRRASSGEGANSTFSYELILKKRGRHTPSQ